ncbi:hypothetical protein FACS189441_0130 [Betaproteobacteria bacterium]|nr:hypothetical protein FACS189441_0130 [Betaproteobacteria bacterium]GHU59153.1 hypothetical protein FACS189411_15660 [Bacteroidia bacterium]
MIKANILRNAVKTAAVLAAVTVMTACSGGGSKPSGDAEKMAQEIVEDAVKKADIKGYFPVFFRIYSPVTIWTKLL